jgi:hypothetical protein
MADGTAPIPAYRFQYSNRVPSGFRDIINKNKLSVNDIAVFMLILERTIDNVPSVLEQRISIRNIAKQIGCTTKTAENSIRRLKTLGLILHKTDPGKRSIGRISINYDMFPYIEILEGETAVKTLRICRLDATASTANDSAQDRDILAEMMTVRRLLQESLIRTARIASVALPDWELAAEALDLFGDVTAVEQWIRSLEVRWQKIRRFQARVYGLYGRALGKERYRRLHERIAEQYLWACPTIEVSSVIPQLGRTWRPSRGAIKEIKV